MKFKFSKKCIQYLKKLPFDDTDEISGSYDLTKRGNSYIVNVDKSLYVKGESEEVGAVDSKYSFHSHPEEAYKKYNVKLGWPSNQDYLSFFKICNRYGTLFHTIITIEGIYIITLGDYLKNFTGNKTIIDKFICDKYAIEYTNNDTIKSHLDQINGIKYNQHKLFNLYFTKWSSASTKIFTC